MVRVLEMLVPLKGAVETGVGVTMSVVVVVVVLFVPGRVTMLVPEGPVIVVIFKLPVLGDESGVVARDKGEI